MKTISAQSFLNHWLNFSDELTSNNEWKHHWQNDKSWTDFILGQKRSLTDKSGIGEYFEKKFPRLRYRTEDGLFDLGMTLHKNFTAIPTLERNYKKSHFKLETEIFYPPIYDVLLEHENHIYYSWQEVAKLCYVRARLKVLVTYNHSKDPLKIARENEMMVKTVEKIMKESCANFADNPKTEFLLLIGRENEKGNGLAWKFELFDCEGNIISEKQLKMV